MKKGWILAVALAFVLMMFQVPDAKAATKWNKEKDAIVYAEGPYTYHAYTSKDNKSCWIYLIDIDFEKVDEATKLDIPSKLEGRTVKRLGYDFPEEDDDAEFYSNIFGVVVEQAHNLDGYSGVLKNLKKLTIPDTVERIEPTCFSGVAYVKTIKLPPNVKKIYRETFYGCYNLKKIVLPKNVKSIEVEAFEDCPKLEKIVISKKNKNYYVKNGLLIEKKDQCAIMAIQSKKKVVIPEGVEVLASRLLAYGNVKEVVIPASVEDVEEYALNNKHIKKITIAKSSKYLAWDGQCIYDKQDHSLVVAKPDAKGYLRISNKVKFLEDQGSLIGGKVKVMVIPGSVKKAGLTGLHMDRSRAEKVYFLGKKPPKLLETEEDYSSLPIFTNIYVRKKASSAFQDWYEKYDCFNYVRSWNIFKPGDLNKKANQKKIVGGYQYKKINGSIEIVKYVGKKKKVSVPAKINGVKVTSIGQGAFQEKKITSVKLPSTVKKIGRSAFESCKKLSNIDLPNSVKEIDARALMGCKSLEEVQIPNQLTLLHGKVFKNCVKLKKITIPESVREINMQCFAGCLSLETVDMPEDLESTQAGVFMNCKALKSIVLPKGLSHLAGDLFSGCENLETVDVKGEINSLGSGTFRDCYQLKKLEPVRITETVYYSAFKNCKNLESTIEIMPGCNEISSGAFANCPKIKIKNIENAAYVAKDAFQ